MWFIPFSLRDLIDIFLVALVFYWIYRSTRGTNAPYILTGLVLFYLFWVVVRALNMELLSSILGQLISVGVVALIILFQPEIRRFLQMIGYRRRGFSFLGGLFSVGGKVKQNSVEVIIAALREVMHRGDGALVVISQQSDLSLLSEGGERLDARLSVPLLSSLFIASNPLSEGAVIIAGSRVLSARSILPFTQCEREELSNKRNRAALGLSEISDAIVVTLCDNSGELALAYSGDIHSGVTLDELSHKLMELTGHHGELAEYSK